MTQPTLNAMGMVYLVGSGPGAVEYLTLRGYQLLCQAEVIVYDALVDEALLHLAPGRCQTIDVGKRGGKPSLSQTEIDRLLVQLCCQGRQVVRLKSGDPFIFGRSASEMQALIAAGCPFEVVPGLSSALAAPLLAGIPLTDPVLSRCFAVLTAHDPDALDWEALAGIDTLVILMGGQQLATIIDQLERHGRSPQTPIAIIRWAGHPDQHIWTGTLQTIVQQTARQSLSPAIITIGEVVGLRPYLQSPPAAHNRVQMLPDPSTILSSSVSEMPLSAQEPVANAQRPLMGKTILVTRAAGQSSQFTTLLQAQGATVLEMPALEIGPPSSWQALDEAIAHLSTFDWLILTSTNGVDYFFDRLMVKGHDVRALAGVNIAVVGQKTAASLKQRGLIADFIPPDFVADSMVAHFPAALKGLRLLFPRVETGGREVLVQEFTAAGAHVVEVAAYQSGCAQMLPPDVRQALEQQQVDVLTFASAKTVKCFQQIITAAGLSPILDACCVASIGPQTSVACQTWLGRVDIEANEYTLDGLTEAIVQWVGHNP